MTKKNISPRVVPDRDSKYMGIAWMYAGFSKDPNSQIGAAIIPDDNSWVSTGYNGPPPQINDEFNWARPTADALPDEVNKYDLVIHAEMNAINRCKGYNLEEENATLYTTHFPCKDCMKEIVRSGICRIVYTDCSYASQDADHRKKSQKIAELGGVKVEKFKGNISWLEDWIEMLRQKGVFEMVEKNQ